MKTSVINRHSANLTMICVTSNTAHSCEILLTALQNIERIQVVEASHGIISPIGSQWVSNDWLPCLFHRGQLHPISRWANCSQ